MTTYTPDADKIVHYTMVDLSMRQMASPVHVVQYDDSLPILAVSIFNGSTLYTIPDDASVNIRLGKTDGTFVYNPALGCDANRHTVYIEVTQQMTTWFGELSPVIEVVVEGSVASSSPISLVIDRNPVQQDDVESTIEYKTVAELVVEVTESAEQAETAKVTAVESATAANASKVAAAGSASNAAASETAANASKVAAAGSASNAAASETAANASKVAAAGSATSASDSETAANASKVAAAESATSASDSETAANASKVAAAESASNASASETAANASKVAAAESASNASASETAANASEVAAAESASNASASETAANASEAAAAESAEQAESAYVAITDMAVSAYTALYGLPASVQKIVDPDTGAVSLQFAIPKGEAFGYDDFTAEQLEALKGDPGDTTPAIDNLTSTDTDAALSANQGRVLNEALADKINATFETLSFNDDLNSIMPDGKHERYVANQYCDNIPYGSFGGFVDVCGANTSGGYRCTQTFVDAIDGTTYTRGSAHNIWTEWAEHATFNECMVGYAVCTVTANVAAKIVSIEGFKVTTGAHISVLFTEGNTAHNATLNINATGAKPIWLNGVSVDTCSIYAGAVLELVYDGAHYVIVGGVQSTPSDVKFQWEEVCELVFTNDSASVAFPSDVNFYGAATFLAVPDFTSSFPASYSFGPDSTHDDALSTNWTLVHCPFKAPIAVQNDGVDIGLQGSTCLSLSYGATNATSGYCTLNIATTGSIKIYLEKIAT